MPARTNSDKISELEKFVERLTERLDAARNRINELTTTHATTQGAVADLRRELALLNQRVEKDLALSKSEHDKELALLRREIAELARWKDDQKKHKDELERRVWSFGPNVIAALISVILSAVIAAYLSSRK